MQVAGTADAVRNLRTDELTKVSLRSAFAGYADTHSAASVRRCWSTLNTLCTSLLTAELVQANPMPLIGCPKGPKTLPKSYPARAVTDLVAVIDADHPVHGDQSLRRRGPWAGRCCPVDRRTRCPSRRRRSARLRPFIYVLEELTVDRLQVNKIVGAVAQ